VAEVYTTGTVMLKNDWSAYEIDQLLSSYGYRMEASRQAVHHIANLSEHLDTAGSTLDVLTQCAQRDKLFATIRLGTPVDPALVAWALKVLVEGGERPVSGVAQETLIRFPVI
jgi:hypothetical protein